jgi:hypothetical protein
MKLRTFAAAIAAACLALCVAIPAATAQHVIDPSVIQPGAAEAVLLQAPMPAAGAEWASDHQVEVPWGAWLGELISGAFALLMAALLWMLRRLPASAVAALNMLAGLFGQNRVDALLERAVQYGINATKGAVKDRVLTVNVGNEVLERAFEYAVRHAPALVAKFGGLQALREKIIARLNLEADAAVPVPRPPATEGLVSVEVLTAHPAPTP